MKTDYAPNCPGHGPERIALGAPHWDAPTPHRPFRACSHCGSAHPLDWAAMACLPGTTIKWRLRDGIPDAMLMEGIPDLSAPQGTRSAGLNTMHLLDLAPKAPAPDAPAHDPFSPVAKMIHDRTGWIIALTGTFAEPTLEFSRRIQVSPEPDPPAQG